MPPWAESGGVLLGGYGGTWLGPTDLSTPLSAEALTPLGSSVGAGVVVVSPCRRLRTHPETASGGQLDGGSERRPMRAVRLTAWLTWLGSRDRLRSSSPRRPGPPSSSSPSFLVDQVDGRGACRHPDGAARFVASALRVFAADVDHHVSAGPCARGPTVRP